MVYFKFFNRTYTVSIYCWLAGWRWEEWALIEGVVVEVVTQNYAGNELWLPIGGREETEYGCRRWTVDGNQEYILCWQHNFNRNVYITITIHNFTIFIFNSNHFQQKHNSNNDRFNIFVLHVCNSIILFFFQPHILCIVVFIHFICLLLVCSTIFEHKNCVFANEICTKKKPLNFY